MLVPCPSCGKRVSDRAPQCPFCKASLGASNPVSASETAPPIANVDSAIRDGGVPASLVIPPPPPKPAAAVPASPPPQNVAPPEAPMALPAYQRGDFIGDSLQVIETLGEGGFGIVYLARSLASNEIVAVKTLRGELLRDAKTRAMFEKEARIWMDLGVHPNLVRARWITEIGGRLYIAMDYVRAGAGRPNGLEGHLEKGPIALDKTLLWAIEFCRGMEYAISKGIRCHRDIKPANILIGSDDVVKISDFGIAGLAFVPDAPGAAAGVANAASDGDPSKTVVGTVFGTPTHMSPEQFVDAASCDARSDIYSFGVVLYQMASAGRLPFLPPPPPAEFAAQSGAYYWHAFRTLHTTAAEAPLTSPLAEIISRTLRKKREERYPNFGALRKDLEAMYEKVKGEKAPVQAAAKETSDTWNDRGISFAALNRWDEALSCYDKALSLERDSAALHNNRGNALRHLGRVEESAAAYDEAVALDPLYAAAWENRALLYANAQRNQEALACIERSLSLDPTSGAAWVIKGVMLGRLQRRDEELAAYDEALRIDPRNVPAWLNKANVLGAINRVLALECANQVLACDPANASGWDLKGTLLAELGRPSEAIPCHLEAQRLAPRDGRVAYNLGNAWTALGRLEEGRAAYEESTRLAPDMPVTWYNLALSTFRLGRHAQSIPLFEHFLSLDPPRDGLRKTAERLTSEMKAGRIPLIGPLSIGSRITSAEQASIDAGALPELKEPPPPLPGAPLPSAAPVDLVTPSPAVVAIPEEPLPPPRPNLDALLVDAANLFKAGRFDASLKVADLVLKLDPRLGNALNTRANTLFKLGRRDEACAAMISTIESEPGDLRFWLNKVVIENGAGRPSDAYRSAIDLIEIAQVSGKKSPEVDEAGAAIRDLQARGTIAVPRGHLGWLGLGFESMVSGRQEAGLDFFGKAVAEAPKNIEALRWKGSALKEMKRADDALACFDRALALSPNDPEIHHDRGIVLSMLRDYKGAIEAFDRALARNPDHVASLSDKGKYASEIGQNEEGLRALRRATALMPDHPAPWINRAMVEDLLKRDDDALASFERFLQVAKPEMRLQIESAKRRVAQLRARVAARKGTPPIAAARPAPPPAQNDAVANAMKSLLSDDDTSDEELLRLVKAAGLDSPESLMGAVGQMLNGPAAAPPTVPKPAPKAAPDSPAGLSPSPQAKPTGNPVAKKYAEQGRAHLAAGKLAEALAAFDKAIERDPNEAMYWSDRGGALKSLNRPDDAGAAWAKALNLNAACVPALMGNAAFENAAGRHAEAIRLLMVACGFEPSNAKAWFELADSYARIGDWRNAYASFGLSVHAEPRNAFAILGVAEAALNIGRPDEALPALEAALGLDPSVAHAWNLRGLLLSEKGLVAEAVESQRKAVELNPGNGKAWAALAHDLHELKRYADAMAAADRAIRIFPEVPFPRTTKGLCLQALGRFDEALAEFNEALAADGLSPMAWTNKGNALSGLKRYEEAIACFSRALLMKPDFKPALDGEAAVAAAQAAGDPVVILPEVSVPKTAPRFSQDECLKRSEMARNQALFDRALEFADEAIVADPRKPMAWAAKAEALFGLKRFADAAAHAKKVVEMNPKFGPGWMRLAASYDALGAFDLALPAWDKTVETAGHNVLNWTGRGLCLAKLGRIEDALACHDKALALDPRFSLGKFHKGLREADLGRREDAVKSLQQFLALAPPNLSALAQEARQRIQELKA